MNTYKSYIRTWLQLALCLPEEQVNVLLNANEQVIKHSMLSMLETQHDLELRRRHGSEQIELHEALLYELEQQQQEYIEAQKRELAKLGKDENLAKPDANVNQQIDELKQLIDEERSMFEQLETKLSQQEKLNVERINCLIDFIRESERSTASSNTMH